MRHLVILFAILLSGVPPAVALEVTKATITLNPAKPDVVKVSGSPGDLVLKNIESFAVVVDGVAYDVPVERLVRKKLTHKFKALRGETGVKKLVLDGKKRTTTASRAMPSRATATTAVRSSGAPDLVYYDTVFGPHPVTVFGNYDPSQSAPFLSGAGKNVLEDTNRCYDAYGLHIEIDRAPQWGQSFVITTSVNAADPNWRHLRLGPANQ